MRNLILKSILVSVFTFFAVGSINAQDVAVKKAKEVIVEKSEGVEETMIPAVDKLACKPGCEKVCCTAKAEAKKACKPGCEKACCTAKEGKKVSNTSVEGKKSCTKGAKKACSKSKKVADAKACSPSCEKACCVS